MPRPASKKLAIEVVDVDLESDAPWSDALDPLAASGTSLLKGFHQQALSAIRSETGSALAAKVLWGSLHGAAGMLHSLLGSQHGDEIDDIANALDASAREIVLANVVYDISNIGCSAVAAVAPEGPLHARNLDWPFPRGLLRKHLFVARMRNGRRGDYALVTWPGMFGALTGIAPGRFSITVNFVTHEDDSNAKDLAKRALAGYWPVTWVVRRAFDEAKDFKAAVKLLKDELLLAPVLLTVVGTKDGERAVIECSCDDYEIREPEGKEPLIVTNHYELDETDDWNIELDDLDTCDRFEALEELVDGVDATPDSLLEALSDDDVFAEGDTQYQVVMQPATGRLIVRVPGRPTLDMVV
jgi:hypothetical protein